MRRTRARATVDSVAVTFGSLPAIAVGFALSGCHYASAPILADEDGVGALCDSSADCPVSTVFGQEQQLTCLTQYEGGYCALPNCTTGLECPTGSICIDQPDGNYCVRSCKVDSDCNANRPEQQPAFCNGDFEYAHESAGPEGFFACLPPQK